MKANCQLDQVREVAEELLDVFTAQPAYFFNDFYQRGRVVAQCCIEPVTQQGVIIGIGVLQQVQRFAVVAFSQLCQLRGFLRWSSSTGNQSLFNSRIIYN